MALRPDAVRAMCSRSDAEEILVALRPKLLRSAARIVGPFDAEDVVSDVIERSLRHGIPTDVLNLGAYFVTATRRAAIRIKAANRRRLEREIDAHRLHPSFPERADAGDDLGRLLVELPSQQRSAIFHIYWLGFTESQTAQQMGLSKGSVSQHHHRAKVRLRRRIEDGGRNFLEDICHADGPSGVSCHLYSTGSSFEEVNSMKNRKPTVTVKPRAVVPRPVPLHL